MCNIIFFLTIKLECRVLNDILEKSHEFLFFNLILFGGGWRGVALAVRNTHLAIFGLGEAMIVRTEVNRLPHASTFTRIICPEATFILLLLLLLPWHVTPDICLAVSGHR